MPEVKDIMSKEVVSVPPSAHIIDVAQKMLTYGQHIILVCDNDKLYGVVTERDIVVSIVATARDPIRTYISSLMKNHLPSLSSSDDILLAAKLMVDHATRVLTVVENGKLAGLLTLDDLARESPALAAMVFCKTVNATEQR